MESKASNGSATARKGRWRSQFFWWVAALAAVFGWLLHESLFEGKGLVPADSVMSFLPWQDTKGPSNILLSDQYLVFVPQKEFVHREFLEGKFPLWNPYIDCGVPNLGSFQGALLYPINLLLLAVPPFYASGVAAFLKLMLAGWFMMLYLRQLGVSNSGAFLAAIMFSLSGFMIVWLGHPHVNSAIFLPLLLYWTEKFFQRVRERAEVWRAGIGFALTVGCMLFGGHPPTMVHLTLFTGAYFLFRWVQHRQEWPVRQTVIWAAAAVLGFMIAAPAVLPFLEYDHYSAESFSSEGLQRSALHLPLNSLIFYLLPKIAGSPIDGWQDTLLRLGVGNSLPNFNERTGYVGILGLMFAAYAMVRLRCGLVQFYMGVVALCLMVVCGMPPVPSVLGALPVLHDINPMRLTLVIGFSVAVLAGLGWDAFRRSEKAGLRLWTVAVFWGGIGLGLTGYGMVVAPRWHWLEPGCRAFLEPQFLMLGGSLIVSVALLLPTIRQRPGLFTTLGLVWVATDMLTFAAGYNPAISRDRYYPPTPGIEWLQKNTGHYRILGDKMLLPPNVSEVFGLRDARGCDFTTVRRYEELINGRPGDFYFYMLAASLPKAFPLLGVKYWLAYQTPNPDPAQFDLVYSNEISIFQYKRVCERALAVFDYKVETNRAAELAQVRTGTFDPRRTVLLEDDPQVARADPGASGAEALAKSSVQIISDEADAVTVKAEMPRAGFLVLLDTSFPGWTATVNGLQARVYRADYNFRAVRVPAGEATVHFAYEPTSFRLGLILSAMAVVVLVSGFVALRK